MLLENKLASFVGFVALVVLLAAGFGYLGNRKFCSRATEIRAFLGSGEGYYFGPSYCPATWGLNKMKNASEIQSLPKDKKSTVVTQEANTEIEKELKDNFLGYNKFIAGEGDKSFVIYETICKACGLK